MENNFDYVVLVTFADFCKCSVNSIVAGHSVSKDSAVSIMIHEYDDLLKEGYNKQLFWHTKWGWKYISECLIISCEIHVLI